MMTCKVADLQADLAVVVLSRGHLLKYTGKDQPEILCMQAVVGVTTGELLCACVGSIIRSEYTVYGNAINLSARLMSKAAAGGCRVLCDSTTYHLAPKVAAFNCLKLVEVGWSSTVYH